MLSNLELTALVAMAAAFVVSFIIMVVLYVALRRENRKVAELNSQVEAERDLGELKGRMRKEEHDDLTSSIAERDHRIKVLEGTVASQRESMAGLRDAFRTRAFDSSFTRGGTPDEIVAAAKKFERYLRGKE